MGPGIQDAHAAQAARTPDDGNIANGSAATTIIPFFPAGGSRTEKKNNRFCVWSKFGRPIRRLSCFSKNLLKRLIRPTAVLRPRRGP